MASRAEVMEAVDDWLHGRPIRQRDPLTGEEAPLDPESIDPETWGTGPEAEAGEARMMAIAGQG